MGEKIANGVVRIAAGIANAYIVGNSMSWALVDTGTEGNADKIRTAAEQQFGARTRPQAIILTHGHFDHAGSAGTLAEEWDVPILAHRLEMPYLTGLSNYPPPDPRVGGFMAQVIRFVPNHAFDYGSRVQQLPMTGDLPGMHGWRVLETPGHTPGHVSFFREQDALLLAGDAFTTINQDSFIGMISKKPVVSRPPAYYTTDWEAAHLSVQKLSLLTPEYLCAGHGEPMQGDEALMQLRELADNFNAPTYGRYVKQPARADESGVTYVPPAPPDPVKRVAIGVGIAAGAAGVTAWALKKREKPSVRSQFRRYVA